MDVGGVVMREKNLQLSVSSVQLNIPVDQGSTAGGSKRFSVHTNGGPEVIDVFLKLFLSLFEWRLTVLISLQVLKWEDVQVPDPKQGEIRLKQKAIGVNFLDVYMRQGLHNQSPPLPFTPGREGAGVVVDDFIINYILVKTAETLHFIFTKNQIRFCALRSELLIRNYPSLDFVIPKAYRVDISNKESDYTIPVCYPEFQNPKFVFPNNLV
ncbi:hypothetical protein LXL04_012050 [Taraxacum kok-saghyz]